MSLLRLSRVGVESNRNVNRPIAVVAVTTLGVVGSIVFLLLPMLIGAFTEALSLGAGQVGWLGSADMAGMFIAAVVATLWVRTCNWRMVAAIACGLLFACHLFSAFIQAFEWLLPVRVVAGFAGGSLMSIALTSLGDSRQPDRFFALFVAAQLTLGALALWLFPDFLAQQSLRGVFIALAVLVLATGVLVPFIPEQGRLIERLEPRVQGDQPSAAPKMKGVMALAACLIFNMGIMAIWAYLERMGSAAGLEAAFVGRALALSLAGSLFGALVAAAMADRFGRIMPLVITAIIQVIAVVLLGGKLSNTTYLAGVMLFAFAWNFPVAYQLAITVSVDVSGRLVVLFLSAVKLGYAIAPVIAAQLFLWSGGYLPVMILAMTAFLISALLFIALARPAQGGSHPGQ